METKNIVLCGVLWAIVCFFSFMFWSSITYDEDAERKKIGLWGLPFFFIPLFPMVYYLFIVPMREHKFDFGVFKYFANLKEKHKTAKHKKYVDKLLDDNDEIELVKVDISDKIIINLELNVTETKTAEVTYRYVNDEVHAVIGFRQETIAGAFAEKIAPHVGKKIYLKYTELKLMILNNRLDGLYK